MISRLNSIYDKHFYLFFDVETSPKYFLLKDNKKIENCPIITPDEYLHLRNINIKEKKIIHPIGRYNITKMITLFDENNNSYCMMVDDKFNQTSYDNGEIIDYKNYKTVMLYEDSEKELIDLYWDILINQYLETFDAKDLRIFAHNIGFDSKQINLFEKIKFINEDCPMDEKIESCCLSKPFYIKFKYNDDINIQFDDSFSFFSSSLKSLGNALNIPKKDFKFNEGDLIIDDKTVDYGITDSFIIKEAICNLKDMLYEKELGKLSYTIAGTAMNVWRTSFLPYKIDNSYGNDVNLNSIPKLERKCYFGGRNECRKIGLFKNIYYFDINSLYPYVMENNKFPTSFKSHVINEKGYSKKYIEQSIINNSDDYYFILKVKINTKIPHLPIRSDRLMFVKGEHECYMQYPEFLYFYKRNEVVNVTEVISYNQDYIFKDYIKFFKKMKIENENNPAYRQNAKIFQNSLYGKLAQKLIESKFIDNEEIDIGRIEILPDNLNEIGEEKRIDNFGYFGMITTQDEYKNAKQAFPAIAGAVTSYARLELLKMMDLLGLENVLYCDTDSLMSIIPIPDKYIHDYKYGYWKNESHKLYKNNGLPVKETLDVIIKGCKNYILLDIENDKILESKSKGIKKDSIEIDDEIFLTNKWWTVKTSKVKKETMFTLNHTVIMDEIKTNTLEYLKGKSVLIGKKSIKIDGITIKYNERNIRPWLANELEKLENENLKEIGECN